MKTLAHQLALDAAKAGLIWLLALLALEAALSGFVSRFFNVVWLVLFTLAMSIAAFATQPRMPEPKDEKRSDAAFFRLVGVLAATYAFLAIPASMPLRLAAMFAALALGWLLPKSFSRT